MNTECRICGFDVRQYPATVEVEANAHTFYCPVCGQSFDPLTGIPREDVFYDEESRAFVKWATPTKAAQPEVPAELPLGSFKLQVRARTKDYQKLFYEAVLVFVLDGEIAQNQLFAPPDSRQRYGLNIIERTLKQNDTYIELLFEMKGASRPYRTTLRAAVTRATTDAQSSRVGNGSALTIWPNFKRPSWKERREDGEAIEHKPWRNYFVQFETSDGTVKPKSLLLFGDEPGQRAFFDGSSPKGALDFAPEYVELVAEVTRPGALLLSYYASFEVKLDSFEPKKNTLANRLRVAIDFGTSNTCLFYVSDLGTGTGGIASGTGGDPKPLRLTNKSHEVIRGLSMDDLSPCTWLPDMKGHALIPSELIFAGDPLTILNRNSRPSPVVDYTIPSLRWRSGQEPMICTGFKWKQATEPSAVREQYRELQRMYLDLLFRMALAEFVAGGPLSGTDVHPNSIDLVYTYPLAMPEDEREKLKKVFEAVIQPLREHTGITINVGASIDESRAGETGTGMQEPGQRIFIDIGGGTTDIAVIEQRRDVAHRELLLVDSVRYAGNDFLAALADDARGGHIATGSLIELQRRVRAARDGAALEDPSVFGNNEERKEQAQKALERFLVGLTQYLARIIALRVNQLGEEAAGQTLHIFLLGNGWRFVLFLPRDPLRYAETVNPRDFIREQVTERLNVELAEFVNGGIIPAMPSFELRHPEDPKTVVARGALESTRLPPGGQQQTFIGTNVIVVTQTGTVPLSWDTIVPRRVGALIDRVSIQRGGLGGLEQLRVPDYKFEDAPRTYIDDIDIKRYVADQRGQIIASAFNVYLERWHKNYLTGEWAKYHRGER
ncbi:MAG TPA: hypothetical protein VJS44_10000 [Pyrinomonadaceae bacterium]|nr:hypothetical protein [Pyrinomonadaceae bacterium]